MWSHALLGPGVPGTHAGEGPLLLLKRLLMGDQSASVNPGGISPLTAPHSGDGEADGGDGRARLGRCCGEAAGDGPDDIGLDVGLDVGRWRAGRRWEPFRGGVVRVLRPRPPRSRAAARRLASPCTAAVTCSTGGGVEGMEG